jgi:hypothetical protein
MNSLKAILAERLTLEPAIQDIEAKDQHGICTQTSGGSLRKVSNVCPLLTEIIFFTF